MLMNKWMKSYLSSFAHAILYKNALPLTSKYQPSFNVNLKAHLLHKAFPKLPQTTPTPLLYL